MSGAMKYIIIINTIYWKKEERKKEQKMFKKYEKLNPTKSSLGRKKPNWSSSNAEVTHLIDY